MFKSKDEAAGYLGAMIDGEGHIAYYKHKGIRRSRYVMISNTDKDIIDACANTCSLLELTYSIKDYSRYNKKGNGLPEYRLHIYGHVNLCIIRDVVPIRSLRKQLKLDECIASFERSKKREDQGKRSFADVVEEV